MSEGTEKQWERVTPIFASGEYLAQMCNEIDRLHAEVAQLREERDRFRAALEEIIDPISAMQRWADAEGYRLDGAMAVSLAKDSGHLQNIARRALTPTGADHDKEVTHGDC